jgi:hypothetical protein
VCYTVSKEPKIWTIAETTNSYNSSALRTVLKNAGTENITSNLLTHDKIILKLHVLENESKKT